MPVAALRLAPQFDYPDYGGHKPTAKHIFVHQLVLFIRLFLLHSLATMTSAAKTRLIGLLDPAGTFQSMLRTSSAEAPMIPDLATLQLRLVRSVRLVPEKVFAVPDRLSQEEYLAVSVFFSVAEDKERAAAGGASGEMKVWQAITLLQGEVEKSELLQKYDCSQ